MGKCMRSSLRQLSYLVAVVEQGSVSAAAEQLSISQPAISAVLRNIESQYQLSLFVRERPHKIIPTPVGRSFVESAKKLLEHAQDFDTNAQNLAVGLSGTVEVGCFAPTAPFVIPLILGTLKQKFPKISLKLHEADIDELNQLLANGKIDIALTYDMRPHYMVDFEALAKVVPYALLAANDPLAQQKTVSFTELMQREMITFELPVTQEYFLSLFTERNLRPKIRHQVKGYEMVRSLVGAGEGFSLLLMHPLHKRTYSGSELAFLPLSETVPFAQYGLSLTSNSKPTKSVEAICNICRELFSIQERLNDYLVQ